MVFGSGVLRGCKGAQGVGIVGYCHFSVYSTESSISIFNVQRDFVLLMYGVFYFLILNVLLTNPR